MHLIVFEVSGDLPKIIYPNGIRSVINDRTLKKRSKVRLENEFSPEFM